MHMRSAVLALALVSPMVAHARAQGGIALRPADIEPGLNFGRALSMSATGLLAAGPGNATVSGRAYVFRLTPTGWVEEAKLEAPGAAGFGSGVALLGDLAFVGAEDFVHSSGNASGAVFLFERTGGVWGPPLALLPSDAASTSSFGHDLAAAPGRLLVAGDSQAYVFERGSSGAWTETAILAGKAAPLQDVDLHGERAVLVHSPAFVFEHGGAGPGWDSGTELESSSLLGGYSSLRGALDADHVATLAIIPCGGTVNGHDWQPPEWRRTGWVMVGTAVAAAMDAGRLAVGGTNRLTVLRTLPSGGWVVEESHMPATGSVSTVDLGVDISGNLAALGTPWDPLGGASSGAVWVWELASLTGLPRNMSFTSGGHQDLELRRGPFDASTLYWVFGSATGTSPGTTVDGLFLPLNIDAYYVFLALNQNTVVVPTIGVLAEDGQSGSRIALPPLTPTLVGVTLNHVYLTFDLTGVPFVDFVSNPVPLRFTTESDMVPEDFEATAPDWTFGPGTFGGSWRIVEDGVCGAVTRMAAFTSDPPACGSNILLADNVRLTSSSFRLGKVADYELRFDSLATAGLMPRVRLLVEGPEPAYFEVAWPADFAPGDGLESVSFAVPGIEYALGEDARFEFLLGMSTTSAGATPTGWWIDNVELVELP